ncbi:MAG: conjugal transfer protein TraX [Oscillibacter sp.]|nr:conjugal transfer protein TraX [Oscillibacter sp.]
MKLREGIPSSLLHILAMVFMLCDHLWATMFPWLGWLTCVGRVAFPIFAFMIVEGYFHTHDIRRYLLRLLAFAVISEIPFNLIYGSSVSYIAHQNVLWTFLIGLVLILLIEKVRQKEKLWLTILVSALAVVFGWLIGMITAVDFYGFGVLMVLTFYFFHGKKWWCYVGQFICMYYINVEMMGGLCYIFHIFGHEVELVQQGFALLALIPIWLYRGKQGYHAKWFQYFCYAFYPVHLLLLWLIWRQF